MPASMVRADGGGSLTATHLSANHVATSNSLGNRGSVSSLNFGPSGIVAPSQAAVALTLSVKDLAPQALGVSAVFRLVAALFGLGERGCGGGYCQNSKRIDCFLPFPRIKKQEATSEKGLLDSCLPIALREV